MAESQWGHLALPRDVVCVHASDGSARLVDLNGCFFALDRVGADMLRRLLESGYTAEVIQELARHYNVPTATISRDMGGLVTDLTREGLLSFDEPQRSPRGAVSTERLWLPRALKLLQMRRLPEILRVHLLLLVARVACGLYGWSRTIDVWTRIAGVARFPEYDPSSAADLVGRAAARSFFPVQCKERALSCWSLLRWSGERPAVIVGISFHPLRGHCWCTCDNEVLADDSERTELFTPVRTYL